MRVIYDNVYGCGQFAPAVTDSYPNMLKVNKRKNRICWRKIYGYRFGPYWLQDGAFLTEKQASALIRHYHSALPRKGGTLLVQLYDSAHGWLVAIYHTTDAKAQAVNPGRPKGFPARL
jgi:hypothetical protein